MLSRVSEGGFLLPKEMGAEVLAFMSLATVSLLDALFYRQLLLIGLLWLSVSALSKNDTVTGQEQEVNYFWCWARWGSTEDRTCSLLMCLWCLSNCEILSLGRSLCGSVSISQLL